MRIVYIACILVALLAGYILGSHSHKISLKHQIRNLSMDLEEIMRGEFGSLNKTIREGEISQLYSQIHTLCRRLEGLILRLKQEKKDVQDYLVDISHQLKTPVTAISTYLQIMVEEENDNGKVEQINRCIELTDKVDGLVGNILKLARLEAGTISFRIEEASLYDTVEEVFQNIHKSLKEKKPTLVNLVKEDIRLRYDESWFMEALFNIIKNGILYGSDHPVIEVGCNVYENVYGMWIKDNGPGIKKKSLPYIFERFHRGERIGNEMDKVDAQGTGLGLAIAKAIIEKLHGRIEVESNGRGTTFTIYLTKLITASKLEKPLS